MYARPFIDSLDFARSGKKIDAEVPFVELPRLLDALDDTRGMLRYSVQGGLDAQGNPVLDISMSGECRLRCQRCLQGMDYEIRHDARLMLCDQAELDAQGDDEEEFERILADVHLDVLELLEEEILLDLPIAPRHEPGDCQSTEGGDRQKENKHPFAVLEKLKRN